MYLNNIFHFNKYYNLNIYRKMYILFINPLLLNGAQVIILDYNLEKIINRQQKYFLSYNLLSIKKTMKLYRIIKIIIWIITIKCTMGFFKNIIFYKNNEK